VIRPGLDLMSVIEFKTVGVPAKMRYHTNHTGIGGYTCGCWQCCKIDSTHNLTDFESARRVYTSSDIWLEHHYD